MDIFAVLRALDESDLDPYERTLLMHIIRRGVCYEGLRKTAADCNMSLGKASQARQRLIAGGWIVEAIRDGRIGFMFNQKCSQYEQQCSPDEQTQQNCSPHEQKCSPHEQKCSPHEHINNNINKPLEINGHKAREVLEEVDPPPRPEPEPESQPEPAHSQIDIDMMKSAINAQVRDRIFNTRKEQALTDLALEYLDMGRRPSEVEGFADYWDVHGWYTEPGLISFTHFQDNYANYERWLRQGGAAQSRPLEHADPETGRY